MGLRPTHYPFIEAQKPHDLDWFEVVTENFIDSEGRPLKILEKVAQDYPVALHGVSLSVGSTDPLSDTYLNKLKTLVERIQPKIVSDHLCWTGNNGHNLHDLLPLPFTQENINRVANKMERVQSHLKRQMLLENVSSYVTFKHSEMSEWEFVAEVAKKSGCKILLDINNVFVSSVNHDFDPAEYINKIPKNIIGQIHLAGFTDMGDYLFDTHSKPVFQKVWDLYKTLVAEASDIPVIIEWDEDIPEFSRLAEEALKAKKIWCDQYEI
mgnify:CR=1 FL=1